MVSKVQCENVGGRHACALSATQSEEASEGISQKILSGGEGLGVGFCRAWPLLESRCRAVRLVRLVRGWMDGGRHVCGQAPILANVEGQRNPWRAAWGRGKAREGHHD